MLACDRLPVGEARKRSMWVTSAASCRLCGRPMTAIRTVTTFKRAALSKVREVASKVAAGGSPSAPQPPSATTPPLPSPPPPSPRAAGSAAALSSTGGSSHKKLSSDAVRKRGPRHNEGERHDGTGAAAAAAMGVSDGGQRSKWKHDGRARSFGAETQLSSWEDAMGLWEEARRKGYPVGLTFCKKILFACKLSNRWQEAYEVLKWMEEHGPAPDGRCYGRVVHACAKAGALDKVEEVHGRMEERGISPTVKGENALLLAYKEKERWAEIMERIDDWKSHEAPDLHTYTIALDACAKLNRWDKAMGLFEKARPLMMAYSRPPMYVRVRLYNAAIHACARAGRVREVVRLMKEMKFLGVKPDVCTYGTAIDACAKATDEYTSACKHSMLLPPAAAVMEEGGSFSSSTGLRGGRHGGGGSGAGEEGAAAVAVRGVGREEAVQHAIKFFKEMKARGLKPNEFVYGALVDTCRRAGALDLALGYVQEMQQQEGGKVVNEVVLINLMDAYGRAGEWRSTIRLLDTFVQLNTATNNDDNKDATEATASSSSSSPSTLAIQRQRSRSSSSNSSRSSRNSSSQEQHRSIDLAYSVAITACARAGQWQTAVDLLAKLLAQGIKPDTVTYGSAIWACTKARQWSAAQRLYYRMEHEGIQPSVPICNMVIMSFHSSSGRWADALRVFNEMEQRHGLKPAASTYAAILNVLASLGRHKEALQVLDQLKAQGVHPSQRLYAEVLGALANASKGGKALEVLQEIRDQGREPSRLCLARAMVACSRGGDNAAAQRIYHQMEQADLLPKSLTGMHTPLSTYASEGRWEEVAALLEAVTLIAYHPHHTTYGRAMAAFGRAKDWVSAVQLLHVMEGGSSSSNRQQQPQRVMPTEANYEALIYACSNAQWPVAVYLIEELMALGKARPSTLQSLLHFTGDDVLAMYGPHLYRRLQEQGVISHRHRADPTWVLDFHGFSTRLALCATLTHLQKLVDDPQVTVSDVKDLTLVVGIGSRSVNGVPVLGPYLCRALSSRSSSPAARLFDPPLETLDMPFNTGRLVIPKAEVAKYIIANRRRGGEHQAGGGAEEGDEGAAAGGEGVGSRLVMGAASGGGAGVVMAAAAAAKEGALL